MTKSRFELRRAIGVHLAQMDEAGLISAGDLAWRYLFQQPRKWKFISMVKY
jgi:hypothetical protein